MTPAERIAAAELAVKVAEDICEAYHEKCWSGFGDWDRLAKHESERNEAHAALQHVRREVSDELARQVRPANAGKKAPERVEPEKSRNRVMPAGEFIGELKPRAWRVRGLIPADAALVQIYGQPGDGKSFLALDLAGAIVRGVSWDGRATLKGRVVYVVAEGAGDFRYRLAAYRRFHLLEPDELPAIVHNAPDLSDPKHAADVARQVKEAGGAEIIVIDTLAATNSGDENSSDMAAYVRNCGLIARATGASIWLICHSGKDPSRGVRGWSGLKGAADLQIEVTAEGDTRGLSVVKSKSGPAGCRIGFRLVDVELGRDLEGAPYGSAVVELVEELPTRRKRESVNKALLRGSLDLEDRVTRSDLVRAICAKDHTRRPHAVQKMLKRCINAGELCETDGLVHWPIMRFIEADAA